MNVFIDTNIFLSFYGLSDDDLEELNKLSVLIEQKVVTLHLTQQVKDEFRRNRENKIGEAITTLRNQSLKLSFPQMCRGYGEYAALRDIQKQYEALHAELLKKLQQDVVDAKLAADETIHKLFEAANFLETEEEWVERAQIRMQCGNPPGKDGSLGDAISWECLLATIPGGETLFLISDDKDFKSPLTKEPILKEYLVREWKEKKNADIEYYTRLSAFLKQHFPDIKLAKDLEKEVLIKKLAASGNFTQTHAIVAKLSAYTDFTPSQANDIVDATLSNNQVHWILEDEDVFTFIKGVVDGRHNQIAPENWAKIQASLEEVKPSPVADDDDVPF